MIPKQPAAAIDHDGIFKQLLTEFFIEFVELFFPTVLDFHYQVVQLNRLDWQTYLRHPNPLATALLAKMRIPKRERVRAKRECLYTLAGMRLNSQRTTMLAAFIETYLTLNPIEQQQLQSEIAALRPQERRAVMELVSSWHIEGRIEGRAEEALTLVNRQLARKLGPLSAEVRDRIAALPVEQLEGLAEALLDFTIMGDVIAWLDARPVARPDHGAEDQSAI